MYLVPCVMDPPWDHGQQTELIIITHDTTHGAKMAVVHGWNTYFTCCTYVALGCLGCGSSGRPSISQSFSHVSDSMSAVMHLMSVCS